MRWADVNTESVSEAMQSQRPEARTRWKVLVRYDVNVIETMRVVWGTRTLNITGITFDRLKRWMFLLCSEEV